MVKAEHWDINAYGLESLESEDPSGFLIGLVKEEPVGCILACRYGQDFGFIGMHLVDKKWRRRGYGTQLFTAGMEHLAGRTVGVEGAFSKQNYYHKYGFLFHYGTIHLEYTNSATPEVTDARLADASVLPFNQLLEYDLFHFGCRRPAFLRKWINYPGGTSLGLRQEKQLTGFGCIRPCDHGYMVGPLYAEDPAGAKKIFFSLCARTPKGASIFISVPEKNLAAMNFCEEYSMIPIAATARMYANGAPALPLDNLFSIATTEQG